MLVPSRGVDFAKTWLAEAMIISYSGPCGVFARCEGCRFESCKGAFSKHKDSTRAGVK